MKNATHAGKHSTPLIVLNSRGRSSQEVSELYLVFGLQCARNEVRRARLKTGDEDCDIHYTLRDILATLRVAGLPLQLRLAVVAGSDAIARVYRETRVELASLGCDVRIFRIELRAEEWLRGGRTLSPARRRPKMDLLGLARSRRPAPSAGRLPK